MYQRYIKTMIATTSFGVTRNFMDFLANDSIVHSVLSRDRCTAPGFPDK